MIDSNNLSKSPSGWVWAALGDIAETITGTTPPKKHIDNYGNFIPFVKPPELNDCNISKAEDNLSEKGAKLARVLPPHSILVSCIGNLGKTGINIVPIAFNQQINAAIFPSEIFSKYGFYFFQTTSETLKKLSSATTVSIVNKSKFNSILVPIPPLPEQHRIVAKIEELVTRLDAGVEELKKIKIQLKRYRQSVLKSAFEGKLTAEWREAHKDEMESASVLLAKIKAERKKSGKYKELPPLDTTDLPELPECWVWTSLGQLVWSVKDGPHYSPKYVEKGIPFITGGNVRPWGVDFNNVKYISVELHKELSKRCKPEKGDILYTKGGTTGIARVNTYDHEFNVWVHVAVLKLVKPLLPFYIQHALNSPFCYAHAQKYTHGVGNQDLGLTRMVNIFIPLAPLSEQHNIIEELERHFSVIDVIEQTMEQGLVKAIRLRQSILKIAFEGKLVPQDPNDEPADKLLERIKQEKEIKAKAAKGKTDVQNGTAS